MGPVFYILSLIFAFLASLFFTVFFSLLYLSCVNMGQRTQRSGRNFFELNTLPQLVKLSVTMLNLYKYHLFIFCTINLCLGELRVSDLKSCKEENHKSKICLTGKNGYFNPFPVIVNSILVLRNLIEIDENKNSISAQFTLWTYWADHGISLSNISSG